jgi:AraC family transcriptional regulator, transcriptional activator of pobA
MESTADTFPAEIHFYKGSMEQPDTERQTCSGDFLFIFVTSGIFRLAIDGSRIVCTSDELVVALCRDYYQIVRYNKSTACYLVSVRWQFLTDIKMSSQFIDLLVSRHILKTLTDSFDSRVLRRIMKLLYYYHQSIHKARWLSIASFHAALSLLVYEAAWQQDGNLSSSGMAYTRKEQLSMQFLKLLVQRFRENRSIAFYAQSLCVTSGYLNKAVREVTGKTVGKCIAEITISEAKYLLMSRELSIEDISEQLHFNSAASFSRFFKNDSGMTPSEYRRHYME